MLSDEATVIGGLLVGLNVIDCNLCLKEEDFDCQVVICMFIHSFDALFASEYNVAIQPGCG